MASVPPPPQQQQQQHHQQQQPQLPQPPQPSADATPPPLSWEGDKMFNIYIYDYCHKRGFKKTAKELLTEADIAPDSTPPINARQGLLFEWWSVFWVLFSAKSNPQGGATEDALTYTQHQTRQNLIRVQNTQSTAPGVANGPPPPPPLHIGPQMPPRMMNGIGQRPPGAGGGFLTNGALPNGVGPPPPSHPPGAPGGAPPGGPFGQPNGATTAAAAAGAGNVPGGNHGPPHAVAMGGINVPPGQGSAGVGGFVPGGVGPRPLPMNGPPMHPGQARGVGVGGGGGPGPFQSPTMAHSSPAASGGPQHGPQGQQQQQQQQQQPGQPQPGQQQPQQGQQQQQQQQQQAQFGGGGMHSASPHMANMGIGMGPGGRMVPHSPMNPNAGQGGTPQPGGGGGGQMGPGPGHFGMGRPPSRTTTPAGGVGMVVGGMGGAAGAGGMLTHPSPSLPVRQVNGDIINMEVLQIPNATLEVLKVELGLSGKDISALTSMDKQRILQAWKSRRPSISNKPGDNNPAAGPSNNMLMRPGSIPNLQQMQQMQNRNKRNSNSPGDEHENLPRTESSPPERKRQRTSPGQTPSMAPMPYPGQPQQQNPQQQQQQQGGGGMQSHPPPPGMQGPNPGMSGGGPMQQQQQQPPGMQGPPGPGGGVMSQGGPMVGHGGPGPGGMPPGMQQQGVGPGGGGMQPPMGSGPAGMVLMQGPRMPNGIPHPGGGAGGQMGMPPQMGGIPMNHPPQMGPPGTPQNMMMYRQNMHTMHKNNMPMTAPSPGSGDPSSFNPGAGPQFNPGNPGARPGGPNPAAVAGGQPQNRVMPPPPSPAPGKDGSKDGSNNNGGGGPGPQGGKAPDGSPRNQQTPNPSGGPGTPAPNQQNVPSNQGTPVGGARAGPSPVPGSVMGGLGGGGMNPPPPGGMGVVGGMMGMNPPQNLNQPPPSAGMSAGGNGGGNPGPGGGGPGGGNPGGAPGGGGMGGGPGGASGMHFLGMNPMGGMNAAGTTGLGMNMNMGMGMNPSAGAGGPGAGGGAGMGGMGDLAGGLFSQEFMQGVENALSDIDPSLFRPDGDINFERDFGQWFNHSDDPLDLK